MLGGNGEAVDVELGITEGADTGMTTCGTSEAVAGDALGTEECVAAGLAPVNTCSGDAVAAFTGTVGGVDTLLAAGTGRACSPDRTEFVFGLAVVPADVALAAA